MNHLYAVFGVVYLGMELHAVEAARLIRDGHVGTALGMRGQLEAVGHLFHVIAVAHPAYAACGQTLKQFAFGIVEGFGTAVFARRGVAGRHYLAAQMVRYQLTAVAYSQYRYAHPEQLRIDVRRVGRIYAARAAGKYYAYWGHLPYFVKRRRAGLYLAIHIAFAHAPGYELIVLTAKVEHQYRFHSKSPRRLELVYFKNSLLVQRRGLRSLKYAPVRLAYINFSLQHSYSQSDNR